MFLSSVYFLFVANQITFFFSSILLQSFREYFSLLDKGAIAAFDTLPLNSTVAVRPAAVSNSVEEIHDHIRVQKLIRAFQVGAIISFSFASFRAH